MERTTEIETNAWWEKRPALDSQEASRYLHQRFGIKRSTATLAKLRCVGGGPTFVRAGKTPVYARDDLDAWAAALTSPKMRANGVAA